MTQEKKKLPGANNQGKPTAENFQERVVSAVQVHCKVARSLN